MQSDKSAICFPGQGAHNAQMLSKYMGMSDFASHYRTVSDVLGFSPLERMESDSASVNSNSISSLLTVLVSRLAFLGYRQSGQPADFLSGYSVGQYTALHFSGCFEFDQLVAIVAKRAQLMDRCFENKKGSMIAIAGVPQANIEELLKELNDEGLHIWISNYNCFGQYSLAGEKKAIDETLKRAQRLEPKRLVELPVGGAWHSPLLNEAMGEFETFLQTMNWNAPNTPVINNVTGELMPTSVDAIKSELVKHLSHPVMWEKGIRTLIASGCKTFTEVGYGNVLTKFGFFIDRNLDFKTFSGEAQAVCAE